MSRPCYGFRSLLGVCSRIGLSLTIKSGLNCVFTKLNHEGSVLKELEADGSIHMPIYLEFALVKETNVVYAPCVVAVASLVLIVMLQIT
ncbi:hypothetical protein BDR03DRAFT_564468 [Suillus americanus]|nr:hypothetical protein BDR03DRAFT_564468 [Suillus americanus]